MRKPRVIPQRPSLIEHTASVLRSELSEGTWTAKLPGERELSELLRVSRPTLRAALALLEKEGWFEVRQGRLRTIATPSGGRSGVQSNVIALVSPVPLSELVPFTQVWLGALREYFAGAGYEMQLHFGGRWWQSSSAERELELLTKSKKASAWILFNGTERIQRWFAESSL
ncbi:MAG: GntR family transcriptional regulator, partial [Verrucomicrobia bacterium]|nr:GntR family transcriptional regulator [Verrucomicrobiota bacterium]